MFKITLITVGSKMPRWVDEACNDFLKRLKDGISVNVVEIPLNKRSKTTDLSRVQDKEKQAIETAIPSNARLIALAIDGKQFNSIDLSKHIEKIQQINSHLCFIIGGPEGLPDALLSRCDEKWSLSNLTLPHTIARIVFLESLYRAWSILNNHPYHK